MRDPERKLKSPPPFTTAQHFEGVGWNSSPSSNGNVNSTLKDCHLLLTEKSIQVILGLLSIQIQCTRIKDFHLLSDIMEPMSLVLKIKLMTVPLYTKTALSVTLMLIKMF